MNKIYKYVAPERIDILENLQIRITQPKYLNDPFDLVFSFKKITEKELFKKNFHPMLQKYFSNYTKSINHHIQKFNSNLSLERLLELKGNNLVELNNYLLTEFENLFTQENDEVKIFFKEKINELLGVLSFTKSPRNIPMWAHYTSVHRGFVIIFNAEHSFFNNGLLTDKYFGILCLVNYVKEKTILETLKNFKTDPFFEKHESWIEEKEWRMVLPLELATTKKYFDIFLIDIPAELILGVIFGYSCEQNLIDHVRKLKEENLNHIELYKAVPDFFNSYEMSVKELN